MDSSDTPTWIYLQTDQTRAFILSNIRSAAPATISQFLYPVLTYHVFKNAPDITGYHRILHDNVNYLKIITPIKIVSFVFLHI